LPNGNPQPGPKFDYKLAWFKRLQAHAGKLLKSGTQVVLAGDFTDGFGHLSDHFVGR
jgi:exodeoxyribonuclease-3